MEQGIRQELGGRISHVMLDELRLDVTLHLFLCFKASQSFLLQILYCSGAERSRISLCPDNNEGIQVLLKFLLSDPAQLFTKDPGDNKSHLINSVS